MVSSNDAFLDMARIAVVDAGGEWDGLQIPFGDSDSRPSEIHFYHRPTRRHLVVPVNLITDTQEWIEEQVRKAIGTKEKKMTDTPKLNLRQKMIQIYSELDHVGKYGENTKQKYNFVRAADVMRPVRDAFAKYGVYAEPNYELLGTYDIKTNSGGNMHAATIKVTIVLHDADSDETLTISGLGDGADGGDKGIYKAMTGATKNALRNGLLLPDEADPSGGDPEADTNVDDRTTEPYSHNSFTTDLPDYQEAHHAAPTPNPAPKAQKPVERPVPQDEPIQPPAAAPENVPGKGDAYEEPEVGTLPTEEELVAYRKRFTDLSNELSTHGKLTASKGLKLNTKLLVFFLSIVKADAAKNVTTKQWDNFFERTSAAIENPEVGLIGLTKLINKANGLEPKK
jgi:hypothetical protein